jgi:hypothetical protein
MGDFNGDGFADLAVAAKGDDTGDVFQERVYVYLGSSSGLGRPGQPRYVQALVLDHDSRRVTLSDVVRVER